MRRRAVKSSTFPQLRRHDASTALSMTLEDSLVCFTRGRLPLERAVRKVRAPRRPVQHGAELI